MTINSITIVFPETATQWWHLELSIDDPMNISSGFSWNFEAFASKFRENLEEMSACPQKRLMILI